MHFDTEIDFGIKTVRLGRFDFRSFLNIGIFKNMKDEEWSLKMIPVLIRWAQSSWYKPHYYADLSAAVGHKTFKKWSGYTKLYALPSDG